MKRSRLFLAAVMAVSFGWAAPADTPAADKATFQAVKGRLDTDANGVATAQDAATVSVGPAQSGPYRFEAQVQLAKPSGRGGDVWLTLADPKNPKAAPQAAVILNRDDEGHDLSFRLQSRNIQNRLVDAGSAAVVFNYWANETPAKPNWMVKDKAAFKPPQTAGEKLRKEGIAERSWKGRWCSMLVDVGGDSLTLWFDGRFVGTARLSSAWQCPVTLQLGKGDKVRNATFEAHPAERMITLDVQPQANDRFSAAFKDRRIEVGGVPFRLPQGPDNQLSLREARYIDWKTPPGAYGEPYQSGAPMLFDARMPMLRIPSADYVAAHLLAVADDDPALTSTVTLRVGSYKSTTVGNYTNTGLVDWFDFPAVLPRKADLAAGKGIEVVQTSAGPLAHVRVPMGRAIAQDFGPAMDVELTKELRLAVNSSYRPLGLPSGVRIAAITFEKSPLQMKVTGSEPGNAFVQPQKPTFQVRLTNITAEEQPFTLTAVATHLDGMTANAKAAGKVAAGAEEKVSLEIAVPKRGYYDLAVTLSDGNRTLVTRRTSLALLPPDTRKHRDDSPFGTWQFGGGHFASTDPDRIGPLYVKAGFRYGMWGYKPEEQMKYGVIQSPEPCIAGWTAHPGLGADGYRHAIERNPTVGLDPHPVALMFHEDGLGKPGITDEERVKKFQTLWDDATKAAQSMRKEFPNVKLALGNSAKPLREAFYSHKFPSELFDYAGLEAGGGHPEGQPPGASAINCDIWMERQLLDSYGYKDKAVYLCSESCYPSTGPGRLDARTQADYFIRHSLQALAWGMPGIRFGIISDAGSSYYFTMWGGAGFCNRMPELNVKPSFVAMATLTLVLDGARFQRDLDLGSPSLYGMEFRCPDGSYVVAMWAPWGRRPVGLTFQGNGPFTLVDSQANETPLQVNDGAVEVTLTPSPVYLVTPAPVKSAKPAAPFYDDKPAGKSVVLGSLSNMDGWTEETQVTQATTPEVESEDSPAQRRIGDFAFEAVETFEGKYKVLKVTPRPVKTDKATPAEPMYASFASTLAHDKGIPMPGTPTEIGLWVNGNSSWGRVIVELQDASGQRWVSSGSSPIDFDGWRYLAIPLPGQYPGENYHWPQNRRWRSDKDGLVHYPLTFRKLSIELPEKVLHVKTFAPAPRPEVYLKDLTVGYGDTTMLKTTIGERE